MHNRKRNCSGGYGKFFRITLSHDSLRNIYVTNFALMQHHNYSLTELENMMPWEREIYVQLVVDHVEKENERIKEENQKMQAASRRR